jgi:hypothetical protein
MKAQWHQEGFTSTGFSKPGSLNSEPSLLISAIALKA